MNDAEKSGSIGADWRGPSSSSIASSSPYLPIPSMDSSSSSSSVKSAVAYLRSEYRRPAGPAPIPGDIEALGLDRCSSTRILPGGCCRALSSDGNIVVLGTLLPALGDAARHRSPNPTSHLALPWGRLGGYLSLAPGGERGRGEGGEGGEREGRWK